MIAAGDLLFVDTNILLYNLDPSDPAKQIAVHRWLETLWEEGTGRLSWQVLNEFYFNATRKIGASPNAVRQQVGTYAEWGIVDFSLALLERAWHWVDQAGLSYWDSLILAAAERAGCRWLLSEDFQEGRTYGRVQVVNPFRTQPDDVFRS
jgi:predicted nucleic acid-binding protein